MSWSEQVFNYCERGASGAFWAEPVNAISNGAFIVAALAAAMGLARRPDAGRRWPEWLLTALVAGIGVGSFLFHTYATRWGIIADVAPIAAFMLAYFVYALRRYLHLDWPAAIVALAAFALALNYAGSIRCNLSLLTATPRADGRCLNGTLAYAPAFLALLLVGAWLAVRRHPAWRWLVSASVVFLVSMLFRTIDFEVCRATGFAGHALGTHALWHVLNAATLWLLLAAAIRHGGADAHPLHGFRR